MYYVDVFKHIEYNSRSKYLKLKNDILIGNEIIRLYNDMANFKWNLVRNEILNSNFIIKQLWFALLEADNRYICIKGNSPKEDINIEVGSVNNDIESSNLMSNFVYSQSLYELLAHSSDIFDLRHKKYIIDSQLFKDLYSYTCTTIKSIYDKTNNKLMNTLAEYYLTFEESDKYKVEDVKWVLGIGDYRRFILPLISENLNERTFLESDTIYDQQVFYRILLQYISEHSQKMLSGNVDILDLSTMKFKMYEKYEANCMPIYDIVNRYGIFSFLLNGKHVYGIPHMIGSSLYMKIVDEESPFTIEDLMLNNRNKAIDKLQYKEVINNTPISPQTMSRYFYIFNNTDINLVTLLDNIPYMSEFLMLLYTYVLHQSLFKCIEYGTVVYNTNYKDIESDALKILEYKFFYYAIRVNDGLINSNGDIEIVLYLSLDLYIKALDRKIKLDINYIINNSEEFKIEPISRNSLQVYVRDMEESYKDYISSLKDPIFNQLGEYLCSIYSDAMNETKELIAKVNSDLQEYVDMNPTVEYNSSLQDFIEEIRYYYGGDIFEECEYNNFEEFKESNVVVNIEK